MPKNKRPNGIKYSYKDTGADRKTTPKQHDTYKDARSDGEAGVYPNYQITKGVNGDVWMVDRTMNRESLTVEGPGGQGFQFKADGSVIMTVNNGMSQIIFGENRMIVTGAQDITLRGGGSMRVEGDYNMTTTGAINMSGKAFNVVAESGNMAFGKGLDMAAENMKISSVKSTQLQSSEGTMNIQGAKGASMSSPEGQAGIGGGTGVVIGSGAEVAIHSEGQLSLKSASKIATDAPMSVHNSGQAKKLGEVESGKEVTAPEPATAPDYSDVPMS